MHKYLSLLARNKGRGEFRAEVSQDAATVYLYDQIVSSEFEAEFFGGVTAKNFIGQLSAIDAPVIHLRINSPGGSVFAARAMEQAIREHKSQVVAHVDGISASAASFLMMAADRIEIAPGAMVMIHKAWTYVGGNADDLLAEAALLEKIDGTLAKTYAERTGADEEAVAAMMAAETWLTAEEAVDLGFADAIAGGAAKAQEWDLTAYARAPEQPEEQPQPTFDAAYALRRIEIASRI